VLGIDGVPIGLITDLAARGVMPRTRELFEERPPERMMVPLPEISSVSWTSFMTGANPGEHGIFGFTDLAPGSYRVVFPGFPDVRVRTIWDRIGDAGIVSVVLNQPATYPARAIRGTLVSGFVAPELRRSVHPPRHLRDLEAAGYRIDVDTIRGREDHDFLFRDLAATLAARERAVEYFWDREDWGFFEVVVTGTDRLQHFLWHALADPSHPRHEACLDYYRQVDGFVGRMVDRYARRTGGAPGRTARDAAGSAAGAPAGGFFMLSDHGFTGIRQEFNLNAWLRQEGYLLFGAGDPASLDDLRDGTRAFALDPGRIYIHRRDRFPRGRVSAAEAPAVAREITAKLAALRFEGDRVVAAVHPAASIYSGPETASGPDLVVLTERGFDVKSKPAAKTLFGRTALTGMHTWDDAFLWRSDAPESATEPPGGDGRAITDIAPVILRAMGLNRPVRLQPRPGATPSGTTSPAFRDTEGNSG